MAPHAVEDRVRDEVDWIRGASVLGLLVAVVVGDPRVWVVDDVLQDGAEALGGGVDLRLRLLMNADRLRVAPALEVEDATVAPSMLVVADQPARRLGRERRLARAAQAKKEGDV